MAMLGLLCCMWAFSNCGAQGLPFIMVLHWVLTAVVSPVAEHRLLHQGLSTYDLSCLVALQHMGPSRTRDHIHVPCTGRWTVYWLPGTPPPHPPEFWSLKKAENSVGRSVLGQGKAPAQILCCASSCFLHLCATVGSGHPFMRSFIH